MVSSRPGVLGGSAGPCPRLVVEIHDAATGAGCHTPRMWRLLALLLAGLLTWPGATWAAEGSVPYVAGVVLGPWWPAVALLSAFRPRPGLVALVATVVVAGWVRAITYEPFLDPACHHGCVDNPLLIAFAPDVAGACVTVAIAASVALWVWAMASQPSLGGTLVGTVSAASSLAAWGRVPESPSAAATALHAVSGAVVLALVLQRIVNRLWLARRLVMVEEALIAGTTYPAATLLGRALRDPQVAVSYPGAPSPDPRPGRRRTTLVHGETVIAHIDHASGVSVDVLMAHLGPSVRTAVYNEALQAQLEAQVRSLADSRRRLVDQLDAERSRIERDLHDGAQRGMLGLAMDWHRERLRAEQAGQEDLATEAGLAESTVTVLLGRLRDVARGIHPAVLEGGGLGPALRDLADNAPCLLSMEGVVVPPRAARTIFALAREAATGPLDELVVTRGDGLVLRVVTTEPPAEIVRDRIAVAGGTLALTETGWQATVPCE